MVRVLWVTNTELPEASAILGRAPSPFGGWLDLASKALAAVDGVALFVAFPRSHSDTPAELAGERITYLTFDSDKKGRRSSDSLADRLSRLIKYADPDIVHVFGTEFGHAHTAISLCVAEDRQFVVSIQGLLSVYAQHYSTGLPVSVLFKFTFRDLIKRENIYRQQRSLRARGSQEIDSIVKTRHAIGRTSWDEACVLQINPQITYHKCNEILRHEFYGPRWRLDTCERFTIFVSQGYYPIKGLHLMMEAMPLILQRFPKSRLFVGGWPSVVDETLRSRIRASSYSVYIRQLIRRHRLEDKVVFTGLLNAREMRDQLMRAHAFALPSTIENSPNSLGEAMLLGVPSVASRVGGVPDLLEDGHEGYTYQVDAPYMLAHYICKIFEDDERASRISAAASSRARLTHNANRNTQVLEQIYANILEVPSLHWPGVDK